MRRQAEVERCAELLGITTQVLDIHDGELLPTLENRRTLTRLIREWQADVVICHRPNDYHPDHRNVGLLVQDAAYMVTVPFFCPDVPHLTKNPVFLFMEDGFKKPNPFEGDIVVGIDDVVQTKLECMAALESQFYEGGCCGGVSSLPDTPEAKEARKKQVADRFSQRFAGTADRFRKQLEGFYGQQRAAGIEYAEAFEICEYGSQPSAEQIRQLFPFFPEQRALER
jgi:LmbE family N-acetylglucosaminyl deacetylase